MTAIKNKLAKTLIDKSKRRGSNYTTPEDVGLCKAYVAATEDDETGANRKTTFWKNVEEKFSSMTENFKKRSPHGLNNRWLIISASVRKYVEFLSFFHRHTKSGEQNEMDIMRNAHTEYVIQMRKPFLFDECYEVLKSLPKFNYLLVQSNKNQTAEKEDVDSNLDTPPANTTQLTPFDVSLPSQPGDSSSQPCSMETVQRPPGQKAAKKTKHSGPASSSSFESILENASGKIVLAFKDLGDARVAERDKEREELSKFMQLREEELELRKSEEADRKMKLTLKQEEIMIMRRGEEDRIMAINTEEMPPDTRNYWLQRKNEILTRCGLLHQNQN